MTSTTMKRAAAILLGIFALVMVLGAKTPADPILFEHGLHTVNAGMACEDCHMGVADLAAGERAMPDHDTCSMCHDVEDFDNCGTCHANPDEPVAAPPVHGMYEGFAHEAHGDLSCDACHGELQEVADMVRVPVMNDCQTCHLKQSGPMSCEACHEGEQPVPSDHELPTWSMDHGLEASMATSDCASCHTQQSCDECHQGENITGKPHPDGWMFNHFAETSYGGECLACHETRESCTSCHRAMLPIPHEMGPGYANLNGGGLHQYEARDFAETCLSCHDLGGQDPTCARCHQ